ncbi:MAG TPA: (d)CMP kinase, partial [Rhizomicrobium sp.]|nr:(d)CMP kinase [Rhizomicrobium sp.]
RRWQCVIDGEPTHGQVALVVPVQHPAGPAVLKVSFPHPGNLGAQMRERDQRDSTRADSPLSQAPDAVYLDSTGLTLDQVEEALLKIVRNRITNGKDFS